MKFEHLELVFALFFFQIKLINVSQITRFNDSILELEWNWIGFLNSKGLRSDSWRSHLCLHTIPLKNQHSHKINKPRNEKQKEKPSLKIRLCIPWRYKQNFKKFGHAAWIASFLQLYWCGGRSEGWKTNADKQYILTVCWCKSGVDFFFSPSHEKSIIFNNLKYFWHSLSKWILSSLKAS